MTYEQKVQIYESVMDVVSGHVRKALSRSNPEIPEEPETPVFIAGNISCTLMEDVYGDRPRRVTEKSSTDKAWFEDSTLDGLIAKVAKKYEMDPSNAFVRDGMVCISRLSDMDRRPLEKDEIIDWRMGKTNAYRFEIRFRAARTFTSVELSDALRTGK